MTDEEALAWLLHLVTREEPDQHGQPACFACFPNAWHYKIKGDNHDRQRTPCTCQCHAIRARLGIADNLASSPA